MLLVNVPIESVPNRYSIDWNHYFPKYIKELGIPWLDIGYNKVVPVGKDNFLDPITTIETKAYQTRALVDLAVNGVLNEHTVIFFHDLWHTALPSLLYLRHMGGLKFKIAGILHAGAYDPNDAMSRVNGSGWATMFERAMFREVDLVMVGTDYHRRLLHQKDVITRAVGSKTLEVLSLPIRPPAPFDIKDKIKLIAFPHRLAQEKQPDLARKVLTEVCVARPGCGWVFTKQYAVDQAGYYTALQNSTIAISTAKQETFGIAMIEATMRGAIPIVPDQLAYHELYPNNFRYSLYARDDNHQWTLEASLREKLIQVVDTIDDIGYAATAASMGLHDQMEAFANATAPENAVPNILNKVVSLVT